MRHQGLSRLDVNEAALQADLDNNWEVLAEPIQTVMRRHGVENPYEKLKDLTRGHKLDGAQMIAFVETLDIPDDARAQLLALTPGSYIGTAPELARALADEEVYKQ